ncbi:(Fe-S)-binding protein [Candidatus Dojkabacteria bacterium]|nr:(Fe-S)-binding protein [Candidatus Dojkabacteria bacterium]
MSFFGKLFEKFSTGNTLYYPGCLTRFVLTDLLEKYRSIFRLLGIEFIELEGVENCCGSPVNNSGEFDDFVTLVKKNAEIFHEYGVGKIITNCPACYRVLSNDYKEILEGNWNINVEHSSVVIANELEKKSKLTEGHLLQVAKEDVLITYHDPCHLGRYSGIYDEPRFIINESLKARGGDFVEMQKNKEKASCCGGGAGMGTNNTQISNDICGNRIKEALSIKAQLIYTSCPMCLLRLRNSNERSIPYHNINIKDISSIFSTDE